MIVLDTDVVSEITRAATGPGGLVWVDGQAADDL